MSRWDHKLPISRLSWLRQQFPHSQPWSWTIRTCHMEPWVSGETGRAFGRVGAATFIHPQMQGCLHKRRGLKQQKCSLSRFSRLDVWNQGVGREALPLNLVGESLLAFPSFCWCTGNLWRSLACRCVTPVLCLHMAFSVSTSFSLCICHCPNFQIFMRTSIRLGPTLGRADLLRVWQPTPVFLPGKSHEEEPSRLQSVGSQRVGHDWPRFNLIASIRTLFPSKVIFWELVVRTSTYVSLVGRDTVWPITLSPVRRMYCQDTHSWDAGERVRGEHSLLFQSHLPVYPCLSLYAMRSLRIPGFKKKKKLPKSQEISDRSEWLLTVTMSCQDSGFSWKVM